MVYRSAAWPVTLLDPFGFDCSIAMASGDAAVPLATEAADEPGGVRPADYCCGEAPT